MSPTTGHIEQVAVVKIGNGARIGMIIAVVTLLLQLAAIIWGAARMSSRVDFLDRTADQTRSTSVQLMQKIDTMNHSLGKLEVKIENLERTLANHTAAKS